MPKIDEDREVSLDLPSDFEDEKDFLSHIRNTYSDDAGADKKNRDEALEDHKFVAGKQWDDEVYQNRIANQKPALTINRLPAFVSQVVGNRRLNETVIKVIPDRDEDKQSARVREELIRSIQKNTKAKRAYDVAFQNQVIGGIGNFEIVLDFTDDDVFDQDIMIEPIHNPLSVVWDRLSYDPTGADAGHVFVTDRIDKKTFKDRWPDANESNFEIDDQSYTNIYSDGWIDKDTVRIASFWRMRSEKRTLAMLEKEDGTTETVDVTDMEIEEYEQRLVLRDDGSPLMREVNKKYAEKYLVSGASVLEGPYKLPINRVPVFRAPGWEINIGDYRSRFGLIRFLRDPQRLHNYWRSTIAEKLMKSPKAKWLAAQSVVKGKEDAFRRSHLTEDNLLVWNDTESDRKPEIVQPVQMETALVQEAGIAAQDIKDISNLHEASLGQTSNEVSGKAIMARQRIGETGTIIYQDNLNMAIEEAGRVINQMIPFVYDTPRVLKIIGDSPEDLQFVRVNYGDEQSVDLTEGKYNITSSAGPSFETKRIETRESMMSAVNAMPQSFGVVADLIAEAQDWPGADKMAKRIRSSMPPEILGQEMTEEQVQAQQAQAQQAQRAAELEEAKIIAEIEEMRARAEKAREDAAKSRIQAAEIEASIDRDDVLADAKVDSMKTNDILQATDAIRGENNV